jgi:hypothetical protein
MRAEAGEATAMATRIREVAYDHFTETYGATALERDTEARKAWALRQEAAAADMQIKREQRNVDMYDQELAGADAAKGTDYGMDPGVYDQTKAMATIARQRLDAATKQAAELRSQADAADLEVKAHEARLGELDTEFEALQTEASTMDQRAMLLEQNATDLAEIDLLEVEAATLLGKGDTAGAAKVDAQIAAKRAELDTEIKALDEYKLDDERLEPLGIDVDDKWADVDDVTGVPAEPQSPTEPTVPTKVIDMEPEVIEGTPPKVIDMEPEVIEVTPPQVIDTAPEAVPQVEIDTPEPAAAADFQEDTFQADLSGIDQAEQQLDQLTDTDG